MHQVYRIIAVLVPSRTSEEYVHQVGRFHFSSHVRYNPERPGVENGQVAKGPAGEFLAVRPTRASTIPRGAFLRACDLL